METRLVTHHAILTETLFPGRKIGFWITRTEWFEGVLWTSLVLQTIRADFKLRTLPLFA
jgi:hypothetical protein